MTGNMTRLAQEQGAAFSDLLDDIRGLSGEARATAVAAAVKGLRATADNEGAALELMTWATHAGEDRRLAAVDVLRAAKDMNLVRMLVARVERPAGADEAAASLTILTNQSFGKDAAAWRRWLDGGGTPW
ncbi:MAG: hypothetical protein KC620_04440 [Myxococcales bacterium]|nr:hypothetical protein [Myxococcales bacterium]